MEKNRFRNLDEKSHFYFRDKNLVRKLKYFYQGSALFMVIFLIILIIILHDIIFSGLFFLFLAFIFHVSISLYFYFKYGLFLDYRDDSLIFIKVYSSKTKSYFRRELINNILFIFLILLLLVMYFLKIF